MSDDGIDWDVEAKRALNDSPIQCDEATVKEYRSYFSLLELGLLLDFGCNIGKWIPLWVKLGFTPIGIDQSRFALNMAHKRNPNVAFVRCMGQNLPFKSNCFILVASVAVFQHNRNETKIKFLREIKYALKREGCLLMTESTNRDVDENWTNDRFFSKDGWIKFITRQGFKL